MKGDLRLQNDFHSDTDQNAGVGFPACLERIFEQKSQNEFEVILVDSGSSNDTLEQARKFPVRIVAILPEEFHHANPEIGRQKFPGKTF